MRFPVHGGGHLGGVRLDQAEDLSGCFVNPILLVVDPVSSLVYQELLGSRGHSLHRLELEAPEGAALDGRVPFSELDAWLDPQRDGVIVGCEFGEPGGVTELVTGAGGSSGDGQVELSRLRAVWTVAPETRGSDGA